MNTNKNIVLLILLIGFTNISICKSQKLIDHKMDFGIRIGSAYGMEKATNTIGSFTSPSLLNYMQTGYTGEVFMNLKILSFMGIYGGATSANFNEWEGPEDNNLYEGSICKIQDFRPGIFFFTPFKNNGFFNKTNVNLSIGPTFSQFYMNYGKVIQQQPTATAYIIGVFAIASINYSLSQNSFITLSYSFNHLKNSSEILVQDYYQYHNVNIGIGIHLLKNKKYLYD